MASSRVQVEVANWIRDNWLPEKYGQQFLHERISLGIGGTALLDAVSQDRRIGVVISTGQATTASGKRAAAKFNKIFSDLYFLILANVDTRVVVFIEEDMLEACQSEKDNKRIPEYIQLELATIPDDLALRLQSARMVQSREVTPRIEGTSEKEQENYLQKRAARASRAKFDAALDKAPDVEPEDYDR